MAKDAAVGRACAGPCLPEPRDADQPEISAFAWPGDRQRLLGGAWFSELGLGYVPCMLCLWQRIPLLCRRVAGGSGAGLAAARWFRPRPGAGVAGAGAGFVVSTGLGILHAGVEWKFWVGPPGCGGRLELNAPSFQDFQKSLQTARVVLCDTAPMRVLGLSFAGWNAVASLLVTALFARAAWLFRRA